MMEAINAWVANMADWIFGWILFLPRDLSLFTVAVLTSASLSFVRKWTTDQEWLHRSVADEERQNQLIKDAKKRGDKEAAKRHKDTITLIKMKAMRFEGKPLLWALIPVALLATWAFTRLAFVPPRPNEPVEVRAYLPRAEIGKTVHLAPEPGIEAPDGWMRSVVQDQPPAIVGIWDQTGVWLNARLCALLGKTPAEPQLEGIATWRVIPRDTQVHALQVRYAGHTYEAKLVAGRRQYEGPTWVFADTPVQSVEVALKPTRLFNFVGDLLWVLPAWMAAYLLICIPFVTILRKVCRIA